MLERCYCEKRRYRTKAYANCEVCEEWHNFQNFAEWFYANHYDCNERLHVDKDILIPGNHIYSPETCLLVPQKLNAMFMNKCNKRGLPNGIINKVIITWRSTTNKVWVSLQPSKKHILYMLKRKKKE